MHVYFRRPARSTSSRGTSPSLTPRADRRGVERSRLARRGALVGGPVVASVVVAAVVLTVQAVSPAPVRASLSDSAATLVTWNDDSTAPPASHTASPASPASPVSPAGSAASRPVSGRRAGQLRYAGQDLGTVSGTYTLMGPRTAPAGSKVAFMLTGPARLVRYSTVAPYSVTIDTTTIPDGRYRLLVALIGTAHGEVARFRLMVANRPGSPAPITTATTTTPSSSAPGTTTTAPTTSTTVPVPPPATTTTTTPPTTTRPATTPPTATLAPSSPVADVLSQTNARRAAAGCGALTIDSRLASAAQAHSADMAAHNYFAHDSQDGRSPFDRMTAAGYRYSAAGENIAMGYRTASDVMTGWMNSAGHRANILNCSFTNIGIGYALSGSGSAYWTQDFGRPQ